MTELAVPKPSESEATQPHAELDWTDEAEKLHELGLINATQASLMSGQLTVGHETKLVEVPEEPANEPVRTTYTNRARPSRRPPRPLGMRASGLADVAEQRSIHKNKREAAE